jgi:chemotaxis protein histidine kinase CheA/ActR/RegA family two-component response regulator
MNMTAAADSAPADEFAASPAERAMAALERVYAVWGDIEGILSRPSVAAAALDTYHDGLQAVADAAASGGAAASSDVCRVLAGRIDALRGAKTGIDLTTYTLLAEGLDLLACDLANPGDAATADALTYHLQDTHWPGAMPADAARELGRRLQQRPQLPEPASGGGDAAPPLKAADAGDAFADVAAPETDWIGADAAPPAPPAGAAVEEALTDEISAIFALAESEDLLGLQEASMRVMQNADLLPAAELRPGMPAHELLAGFAPLAHDCVAARGDPQAIDRLIDYLSSPSWPEPLAGEERDSLRQILLADQGAAATSAPPAEAEADHAPDAVPAAGLADIAVAAEEQIVSRELIELLAGELAGLQDELGQLLAAEAGDAGGTDTATAYAEALERIAMATEAIGLSALKGFLLALHGRIAAAAATGLDGRQREILALLPGAVQAYLQAPDDASAGEGLLDLLRDDAWGTPPAANALAALQRALAMVVVSDAPAEVEARQTEAAPGDVSLALPDDLSQELLDGLLHEMPIQTGDFSAAIQRIVTGNGSLRDVDAAKRAAHTLKGAANTVGIRGIANLTHHVEDILVALSKYQTLPGRRMGEMLTHAGDCLEAMGEAVMGTGPEPDYALGVLQDVLDWANRIDREGVPADDATLEPQVRGAADAADVPRAAAAAETAQPSEPMVRVPASLVDELLRLVGETIISTGQVRERLQRLQRQNKAIRAQNSAFLHLAGELEELVDLRGAAAGFAGARDDGHFDPLEFEQYGELHTVSRRLLEAATDSGAMSAEIESELDNLGELVDAQNRLHDDTQGAVMRTRMVPVATVVSRLQRSVRQTGRLLDKTVNLGVAGAETMVDSNILNELVDPLMHLLRNAVDHGIEAPAQRAAAGKSAEGRIDLRFAREGNQLVVRCRDDGAGLDLDAVRRTAEARGLLAADQAMSDDELARLILAPGFSTRTESTQVSGRGVGMDVVFSRVLQMKGSLNLKSQPGLGMEIELRLPAMLISTHALLVHSRAKVFAISSYGIQDIRYITVDQVQKVGDEQFFRLGEELMPLLDLDAMLHVGCERRRDERIGGFPALLVRDDAGAIHALRVQEIIDSRSLVVKGLGRYVPKPHGVVGATILGDGSVAAVIDLPELMRKPAADKGRRAAEETATEAAGVATAAPARRTAMVVDDSLSARRATMQFMKDAGFDVRSAIDGLEAVAIIDKWKPGIVLVDMEMPRMNGLELTAHLRARPDTATIPVIMITSRSTEKHRQQAAAAGVNAYLTKPFGEDELLRHVAALTGA